MIRAAITAVATVVACTVLLAGVGAGVGWVLGTYSTEGKTAPIEPGHCPETRRRLRPRGDQ